MSRLLPRAVREISTGDAGTDRVQEELARKTRDVEMGCPFLRGVPVEVELVHGIAKTVAHRLGRQPVGWIVTDASGDYPSVRRDSWDAQYLTLTQHGVGTARLRLWVY